MVDKHAEAKGLDPRHRRMLDALLARPSGSNKGVGNNKGVAQSAATKVPL